MTGPRIAFLLDMARRLADQPQTTGLTRVEWADVAEALESHQCLAEALKRCDSEAVWDDLVDMWLVPNEVMDEIRAALREAGIED